MSEIYIGKFANNDDNEVAIVEGDPAEWETNEAGDTLTKYLGSSKNIVIPNLLNGKEIKTIGSLIFAGSEIETIEISNGITTIKDRAFVACRKITGNLIIPNSVNTIESAAFAACTFNGKLVIPNSVEILAEDAFSTSNFTDVEIDMTDIPSKCLGAYGTNKGENITGNLKIGKNVKTIGDEAFADCNFTGNLKISNSVISIGKEVFKSCGSMTGKLTIPNSVTTIGENAFDLVPFTNVEIDMTNIPDNILVSSAAIGELTIGNNVKAIGNQAFSSCHFTGTLNIPNNVSTIGRNAFWNDNNFDNVIIPSSVTIIGTNAFYNIDKSKITNNSSADGYPWGAI